MADRVDLSVTNPGHTLTVSFNDKCRSYLEACQREGICFIPLPVETLGGWHPKAAEELKRLARAQARSTGREEEEAIRHVFQRLSVLLVRGMLLSSLRGYLPSLHLKWIEISSMSYYTLLPPHLL